MHLLYNFTVVFGRMHRRCTSFLLVPVAGDLHKHRPDMMTDSRGLKPEKTWNDVSIGTDTSGTPAVPLNIISRPHRGSSSARSDTDDNNEVRLPIVHYPHKFFFLFLMFSFPHVRANDVMYLCMRLSAGDRIQQ